MGASFAENVYRRKPKGSYYTTSVGLSMMCYRIRKRRKDVFRRSPVERTHGEVVVFSVPDSKLVPEVLERIKGM